MDGLRRLAAAYGAQTSEGNVGGGSSWVAVAATISGLQASTTYHFRIVATNSRGTTRSDDLSFTTAGAPGPGEDPNPGPDPGPGGLDPGSGSDPGSGDQTRDQQSPVPAEPKLGKSVVIAPGDGDLFVRLPGRSTFMPLSFGSELPFGTEVNAAKGSIALTSALPGHIVLDAGERYLARPRR